MRNIKRTAVVGGTVAALIGGGIAFAAWTTTGAGTGSASAGNQGTDGLSIAGGSVSSIYPTGDFDTTVTVTNSNPYPVKLDTLTFNTNGATTTTDGCNPSVVTAALKSGQTVVGDYIAANGGTVSNTFVVHMDADAAEACKGATFSLAYSTTGHSVNAQ